MVAGLEQRNREIADAGFVGAIAENSGHLIPEESVQSDPVDQTQAIVAASGELRQQRLDHGVETAVRTDADAEHPKSQRGPRVVSPDDRLQLLQPAAGAKEFLMLTHEVLELKRQPKITQPDRHLVGLKHPVRQLNVEQPIVDVRRPRSFPIEQKPPFRRLAQNPVFHREFGVGDLNLLDAVQRQPLKRLTKFAGWVVPEDDTMLFELSLEALGDPVQHGLSRPRHSSP